MGRRRTMLRCEPVRRPKQWIRLLALLALVAFVLPTVLASRALFFCRMSGQVMHACCCAGHEQGRPAMGMQLKGTDCCQRLQQAAKAPAPRLANLSAEVAPAALLAVLGIEQLVLAEHELAPRTAISARGPPREAAPIYLRNRAWLI